MKTSETLIIIYDNEPLTETGEIRGMKINNNPATFATVVSSGEDMINDINNLLYNHSVIFVYNRDFSIVRTALSHPELKFVYYGKKVEILTTANILNIPLIDASENLSSHNLISLFKNRYTNGVNDYIMRR